jgi:hypothetical protein
MVDDILRMRATISTEESLAAMRAWGREIGMMPQKIKPGVNELNKTFGTLGKTIQDVGKQITTIVPALGGFGLGAASAAVAAGALIKTFSEVADKVVELREASKELGMSERDIRAWSVAAQKVGISSQSMMQGLKGFHEAMGALQYNQGSAFEVYARGGGPLLARLKQLKDPAEQLKEIFKFKDTLLTLPNGQYRAEQFLTQMGIGADKVRLSGEEAAAAFGKLTPRTKEQEEAARKYRDNLIDLGEQWDALVVKTGVPIFGGLTAALKSLNEFLEIVGKITEGAEIGWGPKLQPYLGKGTIKPSEWPWLPQKDLLEGPPVKPGSFNDRWGGLGGSPLRFTDMPSGTGKYDDFLSALPFPDAAGQIEDRRGEGGGDASGRHRIIKAGVFEALVDFQSYVMAGAGAAGGRAQFFGGGAGGGMGGGGGGVGGLGAGSGGGGGMGGGGMGGASGGGGGGDSGPTGAGGSPADRDGRPDGSGGGGGAPGLGAPTAPKNERGAALYQKLLTEFQKNPPKGLPPDAARFGITKGTPEEWARFGTSVAHAESGFNPRSANTTDPGGSFGVFQYGHKQVPGGNAHDIDASVKAFVRDANASSVDPRGLRGGILGRRFSTIGKHPGRGAAYLSHASEFAAAGADKGSPGSQTAAPGSMLAATGLPPAAFIMHHTSGRGNIEGLKETLRQRHLGVEYGMDREGNIFQIGGPGSSHMRRGQGVGAGLSNRNTVGMEVIAKNDRDVTPAQREAAMRFIAERYPNTRVFGHGEVNPHKEADEGMTIVGAIRRQREQGLSTRRTDEAVAGRGITANGQVQVQIHSNGTAARAKTRTAGDLFQKTEVQSYKQMQSTSSPAGRVNADASTLPAQVGN